MKDRAYGCIGPTFSWGWAWLIDFFSPHIPTLHESLEVDHPGRVDLRPRRTISTKRLQHEMKHPDRHSKGEKER